MKRGILVLGLTVFGASCGSDNDAQLRPPEEQGPRPGSVLIFNEQLFLDEASTTDFDVAIDRAPAGGSVTISLKSADESRMTVTPTLTFTEGSSTKTATLTGVDDSVVLGEAVIRLTVDAEGASNYDGASTQVILVNLRDDEPATGTITPTEMTLGEGDSATFDVTLDGPPSGDVTVRLLSSSLDDATVSPESLTFTATNYNMPQTATVTAIADGEDEEEEIMGIKLSSRGGGYDRGRMPTLALTITEGTGVGTPQVNVLPTMLTTSEDATEAMFTITTNPIPPEGVTITATSGEPTEGMVNGPVTLTPGNPMGTFTVRGVDDTDVDGPQTYNITLTSTSPNPDFDGLTIPPVQVTNNDND